jgi:hypothetical protein
VSFALEAADYAVVANMVGHTFKMKHLAAYLLLGLAGNASPSESDIKGVLQSVGIDADDERLEKLLSELKGKDINEVCYIMLFSDIHDILMYDTVGCRRFNETCICPVGRFWRWCSSSWRRARCRGCSSCS